MDPRRVFDEFKVEDSRGDYIPQQLLMTAFQYCDLNPAYSSVEELSKAIDTDGSGRIEWDEFSAWCEKLASTRLNEDLLKEAFHVFDENGDGVLNITEFADLLRTGDEPMSDLEVQRTLILADTDHSGTVDYEELVQLMLRKMTPNPTSTGVAFADETSFSSDPLDHSRDLDLRSPMMKESAATQPVSSRDVRDLTPPQIALILRVIRSVTVDEQAEARARLEIVYLEGFDELVLRERISRKHAREEATRRRSREGGKKAEELLQWRRERATVQRQTQREEAATAAAHNAAPTDPDLMRRQKKTDKQQQQQEKQAPPPPPPANEKVDPPSGSCCW